MRVAAAEPDHFERRARRLLHADEARHNLILGLLDTLRRHPRYYADNGLWLAEDDSGHVVGAALRTRPHRLVLARPVHAEALAALAEGIDEELPGVVGAVPEVEQFAGEWVRRRGVTVRRSMAHGVYALDSLQPPPAPPGAARPATGDDKPLLVSWLEAFGREALQDQHPDSSRLEEVVDHRLAAADAGFVLWELEGEPVALAGYGGETPNGVRIGPVYTPPAHRRRGFGAAVTAAVTADRLAAGRRFCFLYTDLANPTSNAIYVRLGYRRVCDSLELDFLRGR